MEVGDPQDPKSTFNASAVMAQSIASESKNPRAFVKLSERAEQVASQFSQNAISPFMLATVLRIIEFLAATGIGLAVYFVYVVPMDGVKTFYLLTCFLGGVLSLVALQAVDSYQIAALRTNILQLG
ncbi:MAG: undecaprenyl-phosphate glucose phosphotransferase, partial [Rhizobiaceae bacterium]